jgi:hypothetical protein
LEIKHLTSLVELAHRRHEAAGADLQRGLHLARLFEADSSVPIAFRSLAWHVITASHESAGWPMPKGERFPACCGAAASTEHGCALLIQEIAEQVRAIDGPVLILGALAASKTLFGSWDVLPAAGAYLVPLNGDADHLPAASAYYSTPGIRWGSANGLRDIIDSATAPAQLAGREVLVPKAELITARTAGCSSNPTDIECLIFCNAAYAAIDAGNWGQARHIALNLGTKDAPLEAACRLNIERWLGLNISAARRGVFALKRLLNRHRAA